MSIRVTGSSSASRIVAVDSTVIVVTDSGSDTLGNPRKVLFRAIGAIRVYLTPPWGELVQILAPAHMPDCALIPQPPIKSGRWRSLVRSNARTRRRDARPRPRAP